VIYILDDDDAVRDSLALLLESYGFKVASFSSAAEFTRAYKPEGKDCLILDHHLPGMTGLDFMASAESAGSDLPVILITGGANPVIHKRAQELGVVAFLEKPVAAMPLLGAIHDALADA
jgi:FixJ family two-component response regulator